MKTNELFRQFASRSKATSFVDSNLVVSYSRVSGKEQYDTNLSLETQDKAMRDYAERAGKKIVASFGGTYESAKTDGRKEFNRMLDFIKKNKGKISQILVYITDRFSRTGGAAIKLAEDLRQKYGVTIYAVAQPTDTRDESGVFSQNLQFLFSHYDNRLRRKRAMDGMKAKFERGDWVVRVPLGYDIVKKNKERKIIVNAVGKKLRKAFLWKAEGMKNEEIIERLKAMGVPMYPQLMTKVFKRPFYCGILVHGMLNGKAVEGNHEKLISPEVFLKVNGIHQQSFNYGVPHKKENDNLPLKVFVKCGDCNEPLTGYVVKAKGLFYYKCRTTGCRCNKSAKELHELFKTELANWTLKQENITSVQYALENVYYDLSQDNGEQEIVLKAQLAEVNKKIDTIEEKHFALGEMNKDTFEKFYSRYLDEKASIEDNLQKCPTAISNLSEFLFDAITLSSKLATVWSSGDFSCKEGLQKLMFSDGIHYDRQTGSFRTGKPNFIFSLIQANSGSSEENKKRTNHLISSLSPLAEREGFEPSYRQAGKRFSRPSHSTTLASLRDCKNNCYGLIEKIIA